MQQPFKGVLLDLDGTLIDSNDAHAKAFERAFQAHQLDIPYETIRRLIGKGGDILIPEASGLEKDSPQAQAVSQTKKELFQKEYLPQLKPFPYVRELLQRWRHDGLPLVIATAASQEDLSALLEQAGIKDLIDHSTSRDDVDESKPAPDVLLSGLKKLNLSASEVVFIGDTPYDLEAALAANIPMIAFECGGWSRDHFKEAQAVFKDPEELLRHYGQNQGRLDQAQA